MSSTVLPVAEAELSREPRRLCLFRVADLLIGVDVTVVQEVTERLPLTEVPRCPRGVRGVVNLRGHLVTALDLGALLRLPPSGSTGSVDLIVRHAGELIGLPVDSVAEVLDVPPDSRTSPPDNLTGAVRALVRGVHALDRGLALELDVPALVSAARSAALAPTPQGSPIP